MKFDDDFKIVPPGKVYPIVLPRGSVVPEYAFPFVRETKVIQPAETKVVNPPEKKTRKPKQ